MAQHSECDPGEPDGCNCKLNTMKTSLFCFQLTTPQTTRGPRHKIGQAFRRAIQTLMDDNDLVKSVRGPGVLEHAVRDVSVKMLQDWTVDCASARDACIAGMYSFLPAARRNYHALAMVPGDAIPEDETNCLVCNADGTYDVLLRRYKTAHVYHQTKNRCPPELQEMIAEHLETSGATTWLFEYECQRDGTIKPSKPEWMDAQLKRILGPLFQARGHDVNVNVGLLRKIWRTHESHRPNLARQMMHSEQTAERWYDCSTGD